MRSQTSAAALLVLSVSCGPPPPEREATPAPQHAPPTPAKPDIGQVYESVMDAMAEDIETKTKAAAAREYSDFEEAKAALEDVLPQNSLGQIDQVLEKEQITKSELAEFMRANPEVVKRVAGKVEARLAKVEPELAKLMAKVAALAPPGDDTADRLRDLGYGHLVDGGAELTWTEISAPADFAKVAAAAKADSKSLLLDVRAHWCLPCKELERKVFTHATVAPLLQERVILARLDVTEAEPWHQQAQKVLDAETLPSVLVWSAGTSFDGASLSSGGTVPAPAFRLRKLVTASEFESQLAPVVKSSAP